MKKNRKKIRNGMKIPQLELDKSKEKKRIIGMKTPKRKFSQIQKSKKNSIDIKGGLSQFLTPFKKWQDKRKNRNNGSFR